ncbi:MAG: DUF1501 domain-containing protein [Bacteroidetes bacterium]|nr:DUF1501 domain-containing protein [Bacteroidota bacterium]
MLRRDFLKRAAQAGAILPIASSGLFARPLNSFLRLQGVAGATDRILVLINLAGGNDGLNTVIPVNDQKYFDARPTIAIKKADALAISDGLALHPSMTGVQQIFNGGDCAIVSSVGYPAQDRSHFRSTDIWHTASPADVIWHTGWLGRYLEALHPEYPATLPTAPFAMQIGTSASLAFQSDHGSMGMAIDNPDRFYNLANGIGVKPDPVPATLAGPELSYVRDVIEQSNVYSTKIHDAVLNAPNNPVTYDSATLAQQLKVVARFINGGLPTNIYIVSVAGFDTHYGQAPLHQGLLNTLSRAVKTFLDDVAYANNADRVVCMTYSEFGRRLNENGSAGTDHGAASPLFVLGKPVKGGVVLGGAPDLTDLDDRGDIKFKNDFRQVYASVLQDWLGFAKDETDTALGGSFTRLPLFDSPAFGVPDEDHARMAGYVLDQNTPNPVRGNTVIGFRIPASARVRVSVVAADGRFVGSVVDRTLEAGQHRATFDTAPLASGTYIYTLEAGPYSVSRRMVVTH